MYFEAPPRTPTTINKGKTGALSLSRNDIRAITSVLGVMARFLPVRITLAAFVRYD